MSHIVRTQLLGKKVKGAGLVGDGVVNGWGSQGLNDDSIGAVSKSDGNIVGGGAGATEVGRGGHRVSGSKVRRKTRCHVTA